MVGYSRIEVINTIYERGIVLAFSLRDLTEAKAIVKACADGGAKAIEFRMEDPANFRIIEALLSQLGIEEPDIIIGAGNVKDRHTASDLIEAGVDFIASPIFDSDLARCCNRKKVNYVPACGSISDVDTAEALGVETIGINTFEYEFTPSALKEMLKDRPWTRVMKLGEIEPENEMIGSWTRAGAACFGIGMDSYVGAGSMENLTASVANILWFIKEARGEKLFCGVEHLGIYPEAGQEAAEITGWYKKIFDFDIDEGDTWYFIRSSGPGRIEVLKDHEPVKAHIAIKVRHFERACKKLQDKGIELETVKDFGRFKAIFLKQRDPGGHKVHLLYQALQ